MAKSKEERIRFANHEIIDQGNLDAIDDVFAADYVAHIGGKDFKGTAFVRKFIGQLRSAIPNVRVVNVEVLSQVRDTIAWQRTLRGVHKGDMRGIPPTGKRVEWRDMLVTRFDGKWIAEEWALSELAGQLFSRFPKA